MQGQSPVQYLSPVASTVSPQPTGLDSYRQKKKRFHHLPGHLHYRKAMDIRAELGPNFVGYHALDLAHRHRCRPSDRFRRWESCAAYLATPAAEDIPYSPSG